MLIYTHTLRLCIRDTLSSYVYTRYIYIYMRALNVHVFTHVRVTALPLSTLTDPPRCYRAR